MADPAFIDCPADQWTKVATNVVTGQIWRANSSPNKYLQTYRDTGEAAPTLSSEGMPAFNDEGVVQISALMGIDVYIYPMGRAGRVRVDL